MNYEVASLVPTARCQQRPPPAPPSAPPSHAPLSPRTFSGPESISSRPEALSRSKRLGRCRTSLSLLEIWQPYGGDAAPASSPQRERKREGRKSDGASSFRYQMGRRVASLPFPAGAVSPSEHIESGLEVISTNSPPVNVSVWSDFQRTGPIGVFFPFKLYCIAFRVIP